MRYFFLLMGFVLLPFTVHAEIEVVSKVPFPEYLKKEFQRQAAVVCRVDNCSETVPKVLDILGFKAKWQNGKIVVEKNLRIKNVIFENLPPELLKTSKTIKNFLIGQRFSSSFVENARLLLRFKLEDIGFKDARVNVAVKTSPAGYIVVFHIKSGLPHQIEKLDVICDNFRIKKFVESRLKSIIGKRLQRSYLFNELKRIENHFVSLGYYNFEINTRIKIYGEGGKRKSVELIIRVKPGKQYKIKISGNYHIDSEKILKVLTFARDRAFDEFELEQSREKIVSVYKNSGFPYVKISVFTKNISKDKVLVVFHITEGPYVKIENVKIKILGTVNKKVSSGIDDIICKIKGKPYSESKIAEIKDSISYLLKENGYLNAEVSESFGDSTLKLVINPGREFLVVRLLNLPIKLNRRLPFPYSPEFEEKLKSDISDYYRDIGYLDVRVRIDKKETVKGNRVLLSLRVNTDKGRRYYVGFSLFAGLSRTNLSSLATLRVVRPASFYSRKRIIEQYSILSDTRIFSMIELKEVKSVRTVNPVFVLKEAPVLTVKGFLGYSSDAGTTVKGTVRSSSPFGKAFSMFLSGEYRSTEGSNVFLRIGKSGFFSPRNRAYLSLIRKTEIFESFDVERYITRFEINRKQGRSLKQNYGVEVSKEIVNDVTSGKTKFYKRTLFITTDYDRRDSFTNPERGYRFYLKLSYTGGFLGGDADYFLSELKILKLKRLRRNLIFAFRSGAGYIRPFSKGVPLQDRFYLGGAESIRGYKYGTISPVDSLGNYVGGDFYSLASFELRYTFFKEFQVALFCDTGDVFPSVSDFTFKDWYSSVGAGFRYLTPVGPLRVDYGYKLKPIEGQGRGRFHISFGFPF
ncbi:BamA/OMP85 family outer membrane protein [Desulfurobacterium sp.]